jgi:hypothetical protein
MLSNCFISLFFSKLLLSKCRPDLFRQDAVLRLLVQKLLLIVMKLNIHIDKKGKFLYLFSENSFLLFMRLYLFFKSKNIKKNVKKNFYFLFFSYFFSFSK